MSAGDGIPIGKMTLIPPGTQMLIADNRVVLVFPSENDAIIFMEMIKEMEKGAE